MTTPSHRATAIFLAACEHPADARDDFVTRACGGDPDLTAEVRSLLAAHDASGPVDRMADALDLPDLSRLFRRAAPGDRIGPYEVVEELGRGGMGVVLKARDSRLGRLVALKLLPPHLTLDEAARARFVREARSASALDHPNVCTIYDVSEQGEQPYLAMACYEGETLKDRIARGPLPVEEAVDLAAQTARGLAEAHRRGIVHRDIKPANLMITSNGVLKILDFGIAKVGDPDGTRTGLNPGTMAYMSPEQARGEPVDGQADLWACGVVLYEMLTGTRPFQGAHEPALLYALLYKDPRPLRDFREDVPQALEAVVRKALARDPALRYAHAEALRDDLLRDDLLRERTGTRTTSTGSEARPGTLTFFFSDIEGSTELLHRVGTLYGDVLVDLRRHLREAILSRNGREVDTAGDGFFAVFNRAGDAVGAAAAVQRALHAHPWPENASVRIRIGLHTGEPDLADGSYVGLDVHRAARICSAAHGGQVLLSRATAGLVRRELPEGVTLQEAGFHQLKDLPEPEELFQLEITDAPSRFPALVGHAAPVVNLPAQLTSFVGRRQVVERLRALLSSVRLVTLTGPGGTGKTRLSLAAAAGLIDAFEHGIVFVGLAPITDPDLVPSAIARALDLRENPGQHTGEALKAYLRGRRMLLVLDNFEQVLDAAPFVADLLAACPDLTLLVTSRAPLHLTGEQEFPVPPLDLPDRNGPTTPETVVQIEAVALFVERARSVRPDFELTPEAARAVAEICRRLDGLPLAIELAAARIKVLSPVAMQVRLGRRFQLLTGGAQDRPARHQTLRQAIAWSYDLLGPDEQAYFRRLSVFMGGCTLEAADYVCSACADLDASCEGCADPTLDALDALAALVDQSLLRREDGPEAEPRFVMLETIREYGGDCLIETGEDALVRRVHAGYFLDLAERAQPELTGPAQGLWLDRLEIEHDNLRAAFAWAEEHGEAEYALRLGAALWRFWITRGHMVEGRERMERWLAQPGEPTRARARALNGVATIIHEMGDYPAARPLLEESLSIWRTLDEQKGLTGVLNNLAWVTLCLNDYTAGRAMAEECLAYCRSVGDKRGASVALLNLGWLKQLTGRIREARTMLEESLALRREVGDHRAAAFATSILGDLDRQQGAYDRAAAQIDEALHTLRRLDDQQLVAHVLRIQGLLARDMGRDVGAEDLLEESLELWKQVGNRLGVAETLMDLGAVVCDRGELDRARALLDDALAFWQTSGVEWGLSWTLFNLGTLADATGDTDRSAALHRKSLALFRKLGDRRGFVACLEAAARAHTSNGAWPDAVRLWGAAAATRERSGLAPSLPERAALARSREAADAAIGVARVEALWAEGQALTPEELDAILG